MASALALACHSSSVPISSSTSSAMDNPISSPSSPSSSMSPASISCSPAESIRCERIPGHSEGAGAFSPLILESDVQFDSGLLDFRAGSDPSIPFTPGSNVHFDLNLFTPFIPESEMRLDPNFLDFGTAMDPFPPFIPDSEVRFDPSFLDFGAASNPSIPFNPGSNGQFDLCPGHSERAAVDLELLSHSNSASNHSKRIEAASDPEPLQQVSPSVDSQSFNGSPRNGQLDHQSSVQALRTSRSNTMTEFPRHEVNISLASIYHFQVSQSTPIAAS